MRAARASTSPNARYVVGIDFGTLSGRALLVDVEDGREVATAVHEYADGVIEETLPGDNTRLPPDTALQNPADYLKVLSATIPRMIRSARIRPEQVIGIGTDFTSCTMLPVKADGAPLCADTAWRRNPHAWVKIWKHHAAQPEANFINEIGRQGNEAFIRAYGGKYSSEWFFSKLLETVNHAPEVYEAADRFLEAGDWIVWQLCGAETRNLSAAGFKSMWVYPAETGSQAAEARKETGQSGPSKPALDSPPSTSAWNYPSPEFFLSLDPLLANVVAEKLSSNILPLGSKAGGLTAEMARRTGLAAGTAVAVGNIQEVEGMCGVVADGVVPGLWGYEAGQAGVGDLFAWQVAQAVPASMQAEAKKARLSIYQLLEKRAAELAPGESGLLALDWWNGCRSVLMDSDLSGLLIGATLATKAHEIYRALMEATAFGTRKIIEAFTGKGVAINELYACGGLAQKNPLLMQIYADVTGMPIQVAASEQTSALGAAMHGAVAAGYYPDIHAAARKMARVRDRIYQPDAAAKATYDELYGQYSRLHDLFGRDGQNTMKALKQLRAAAFSAAKSIPA